MTRVRTGLGIGLVALAATGLWAARGEATHVVHATTTSITRAVPGPTDSLSVDLARSVVRWKGTKFRGRGKHEGTVHLSGGALVMCHGSPCGGHFTLDMRTIAVTDIPLSDPVPRERLARHLASRDFFWVERHPTAIFRLRTARHDGGARYTVTGDLTLRGVTRELAFPALLAHHDDTAARVRARFAIDRQRWGVEYRFDPVRNELIDDDIHLDLVLALRGSRAVAGGSPVP